MGGEFWQNSAALKPVPEKVPQKDVIMIIAVVAMLKEILVKGKDYPWPRPSECPECKRKRLWGHGFASAWFDECDGAILLRRYRCPDCGCVIRLKPQGYFNRFHCTIEAIRTNLSRRIKTSRWLPGTSRSRQGHWLRALTRNAKAYLSDVFDGDLLDAFDQLLHMSKTPVSRSM
jgi:hypothetical protein